MNIRFIALLLCFLPGCKKNIADQNFAISKNARIQQEAKFYDMPIPINANTNFNDLGEYSCSYDIKSEFEAIKSFYELEMDNFGWNKIISFDSGNKEKLLIFEKPNRFAAISIRKSEFNKPVSVYINLTLKNILD